MLLIRSVHEAAHWRDVCINGKSVEYAIVFNTCTMLFSLYYNNNNKDYGVDWIKLYGEEE